jgi:hypothetical protein
LQFEQSPSLNERKLGSGAYQHAQSLSHSKSHSSA